MTVQVQYDDIQRSISFTRKLMPSYSSDSFSSPHHKYEYHKIKAKKDHVIVCLVILITLFFLGSNFILLQTMNHSSISHYYEQKSPLTYFNKMKKKQQFQNHNQPQHFPVYKRILHDDILRTIDDQKLRPYGADQVWEDIINKGKNIMKKSDYKQHLTVVEVGAQNEKQSLLAAKAKFHVHCVEPSPNSFKNIYRSLLNQLNKISKNHENMTDSVTTNITGGTVETDETRKFLHLYNVAAGSKSGGSLDFLSTGGTGDHVGEFDMWNMKPGLLPDNWPEEKRGKMIKVPSIQLDDIIYHHKVKPNKLRGLGDDETNESDSSNFQTFENVYALKVDTQGYEPNVFAGLKKSIKNHKIQYIMTEFWPKGMGLIANKMDDPCSVAIQILDMLSEAGYTLYALPTQGHPKAWEFSKTIFHHVADWRKRPLGDYKADCQHFLDYETEFPNPKYHMGYWSDILAVAPGIEPLVPQKRKISHH